MQLQPEHQPRSCNIKMFDVETQRALRRFRQWLAAHAALDMIEQRLTGHAPTPEDPPAPPTTRSGTDDAVELPFLLAPRRQTTRSILAKIDAITEDIRRGIHSRRSAMAVTIRRSVQVAARKQRPAQRFMSQVA